MWISPDDTNITETDNGNTSAVYLSRGLSSLLLNVEMDTGVPTGVYQCLIPDAMNFSTILQIGVYGDSSEGEK